MKNLKQLAERITRETRSGKEATISEESVADAISAPSDDQYDENVKKAVDQICLECNVSVRRHFDKGLFIFSNI